MADQIYSMSISTNISGQFAQNITHWRFDDAGFGTTLAAAAALCNAFSASRLTLFRNMCPNVTTFLSLKARRTTNGQGFESVLVIAGGTTGTRAGGISVAGISPCLIGFPATQETRSRARIFLPGIRENDCDQGYYTSAFKTAVSGALATVFDPMALTGGGAPTATYVLSNSVPGNAIPITEWRLSEWIGTLRRRQVPA